MNKIERRLLSVKDYLTSLGLAVVKSRTDPNVKRIVKTVNTKHNVGKHPELALLDAILHDIDTPILTAQLPMRRLCDYPQGVSPLEPALTKTRAVGNARHGLLTAIRDLCKAHRADEMKGTHEPEAREEVEAALEQAKKTLTRKIDAFAIAVASAAVDSTENPK